MNQKKKKVRELLEEQKSLNAKIGTSSGEERETLCQRFEKNQREISVLNQEIQLGSVEEHRNPGAYLREVMQSAREQKREITLNEQIKDSGAINLTIKELIPALEEGLGLPPTLSIPTGVTGNTLVPYQVSVADMEEVGEVEALTEQVIDFDKLDVTPQRIGLAISVSNAAIDNAAFDLLGFVNRQFAISLKRYIAKKLYSQAAWLKNKGPFSGLVSSGNIEIGTGKTFKSILKAVAKFGNKGFDTQRAVIVMDLETEAELKSTLKDDGQGFVIENGKCAGYDYVTTHYINTKLNSEGNALEATPDKYIGIGLFEYESVQQHGQVRLTIDGSSKTVALKNETTIVMNTAMSFTDLSVKVNKKNGTQTQSFALYKIVPASVS
ncbi:MAG: phage major capsid protein [Prevotella sp.]|nr:phage major capsid protein [Prevotella sp.]